MSVGFSKEEVNCGFSLEELGLMALNSSFCPNKAFFVPGRVTVSSGEAGRACDFKPGVAALLEILKPSTTSVFSLAPPSFNTRPGDLGRPVCAEVGTAVRKPSGACLRCELVATSWGFRNSRGQGSRWDELRRVTSPWNSPRKNSRRLLLGDLLWASEWAGSSFYPFGGS